MFPVCFSKPETAHEERQLEVEFGEVLGALALDGLTSVETDRASTALAGDLDLVPDVEVDPLPSRQVGQTAAEVVSVNG